MPSLQSYLYLHLQLNTRYRAISTVKIDLMKLSFRLRYLISGEIYCGSNLAVLVCRLLPLQMCLESGTLPSLATASGHTWQLQSDSLPHYCQCIHQPEVSREVTWPDILQSESLHIIDSLGSLQHIHHQSPAEKMRQNIQTCMKSCLLQFVEPFLHEYEYWLDTFYEDVLTLSEAW